MQLTSGRPIAGTDPEASALRELGSNLVADVTLPGTSLENGSMVNLEEHSFLCWNSALDNNAPLSRIQAYALGELVISSDTCVTREQMQEAKLGVIRAAAVVSDLQTYSTRFGKRNDSRVTQLGKKFLTNSHREIAERYRRWP
jgi:hypothetical protein